MVQITGITSLQREELGKNALVGREKRDYGWRREKGEGGGY